MKHVLILTVFLGAAASAAEVPWLADVARVPVEVPEPPRPLQPLLTAADQGEITSTEGWSARRAELRKAWLDFLGPLPQPPATTKLETVSSEQLERCTRELVRYEAEPERFVEAYLLRPNGVGGPLAPGVVVFHPTTTETINVVAGTGGRPEQHIGLRLAERGFVALCPKNFLWEETKYDDSVAAVKARHPDSLGMATMLADGMRAVDVLASVPEVDAERIGAIGHSLGAKEVLYLMAFDERVKAGVASEGGVGLTATNWDAPWYLGPAINEADFPRDHHELLALAAPRALLILGGEMGRGAADGDRTWPYVAAAQPVYRLFGEPMRLGLLNHREGHRLSPQVAEKGFEWLEVYLRR